MLKDMGALYSYEDFSKIYFNIKLNFKMDMDLKHFFQHFLLSREFFGVPYNTLPLKLLYTI